MSPHERDAIARAADIVRQLDLIRRRNRLKHEYGAPWNGVVGPYAWQQRFHDLGIDHQERCILGGNRSGKTRTAAAEVAIHLTGRYPSWWKGKRFSGPVNVWVAADTNQNCRDVTQLALLGKISDPNEIGTGWIPYDCFSTKDIAIRQCGINDVVDFVPVRHVSGRDSLLAQKSYEQGVAKFQGTSQEVLWPDEEPPGPIYSEMNTRRLDCDGIIMMTRTPLYGMSEVVKHFMDGGNGITTVQATWDDAPHLDEKAKAQLLASYPEHERDTRSQGVPMMGTGAVFPVKDEEITCDPFELPGHFRYLAGIDFGYDHPAAGVWGAYDADNDVWYLYDCYRERQQTNDYHIERIRGKGDWIPVAWPHDGMMKDRNSGKPLYAYYRSKGVKMLHLSARYIDDQGSSQGIEQAVQEMLDRLQTGRLKVFKNTMQAWLEEKRMYHRENAQIVPIADDLMSATRYLIMMRRYARPRSRIEMPAAQQDYDPLAAFSSGG